MESGQRLAGSLKPNSIEVSEQRVASFVTHKRERCRPSLGTLNIPVCRGKYQEEINSPHTAIFFCRCVCYEWLTTSLMEKWLSPRKEGLVGLISVNMIAATGFLVSQKPSQSRRHKATHAGTQISTGKACS